MASAQPEPDFGRESGDDRARTGGLSVDNRALCSSELRPRRGGGGICFPQPEAETLPSDRLRSQLLPIGAPASACLRRHLPPVGPRGLSKPAARRTIEPAKPARPLSRHRKRRLGARAVYQPFFRHSINPPVGGSIFEKCISLSARRGDGLSPAPLRAARRQHTTVRSRHGFGRAEAGPRTE